jgi:hypothetical protein
LGFRSEPFLNGRNRRSGEIFEKVKGVKLYSLLRSLRHDVLPLFREKVFWHLKIRINCGKGFSELPEEDAIIAPNMLILLL